jgi:hypothetical protein
LGTTVAHKLDLEVVKPFDAAQQPDPASITDRDRNSLSARTATVC